MLEYLGSLHVDDALRVVSRVEGQENIKDKSPAGDVLHEDQQQGIHILHFLECDPHRDVQHVNA